VTRVQYAMTTVLDNITSAAKMDRAPVPPARNHDEDSGTGDDGGRDRRDFIDASAHDQSETSKSRKKTKRKTKDKSKRSDKKQKVKKKHKKMNKDKDQELITGDASAVTVAETSIESVTLEALDANADPKKKKSKSNSKPESDNVLKKSEGKKKKNTKHEKMTSPQKYGDASDNMKAVDTTTANRKKKKKTNHTTKEGPDGHEPADRDIVIGITPTPISPAVPVEGPLAVDKDEDNNQKTNQQPDLTASLSSYREFTAYPIDADVRREADRGLYYSSDDAEGFSSTDDDVTTDEEDDFLLVKDRRIGGQSNHSNGSRLSWRDDYVRRKAGRLLEHDDVRSKAAPLLRSDEEKRANDDSAIVPSHDGENSNSMHSVSFHDDIANSQHLFGGQSEIGRDSSSHRLMGSTIGRHGSIHRKDSRSSTSVSRALSTLSIPIEDATELHAVLAASSTSSDDESFAIDRPLSKHDKKWEYRVDAAYSPSDTEEDSTIEELVVPHDVNVSGSVTAVVANTQTQKSGQSTTENGIDDDGGTEAQLIALQRKAEKQRGDPSNYNSADDDDSDPLADFQESQSSFRRFETETGMTDDDDEEDDEEKNHTHWHASVMAENTGADTQEIDESLRSSNMSDLGVTWTFRRQKEQREQRLRSRTGLDPPAQDTRARSQSPNQIDTSRQRENSIKYRSELREDLEAQVKAQFADRDENFVKKVQQSIQRQSSLKASDLQGKSEGSRYHENTNALAINDGSAEEVDKETKKSSRSVKPTSATSVMDDSYKDLEDQEAKSGLIEKASSIMRTRNFVYALVLIVFLLVICVIVLIVYFVRER
jgi:hypothetical protein